MEHTDTSLNAIRPPRKQPRRPSRISRRPEVVDAQGGPMTGNGGGPMPLAKPAARWSHVAGKRQPHTANATRPATAGPGSGLCAPPKEPGPSSTPLSTASHRATAPSPGATCARQRAREAPAVARGSRGGNRRAVSRPWSSAAVWNPRGDPSASSRSASRWRKQRLFLAGPWHAKFRRWPSCRTRSPDHLVHRGTSTC